MKQLRAGKESYDFLSQIKDLFLPNELYRSPRVDRMRDCEKVYEVDLRTMPNKLLVFVSTHRATDYLDYTLKVKDSNTGRLVHIWSHLNANGLVGPLEGIVSFTEDGDLFLFEEGVIKKGNFLAIPHFSYITEQERFYVQKPIGILIERAESIIVQYDVNIES